MRAEMDRIEQWIARRAEQAHLTLILKKGGGVSWPRTAMLFAAWLLVFIALPTWLLSVVSLPAP